MTDRVTRANELADDLDKWVRAVETVIGSQRAEMLREVSEMLRVLVCGIELDRKAMYNRTHGHQL